MFTGVFSHLPYVHRAVNARYTGCFPMFSGVSQLQNNAFAGVFSDFSCIFSNSECAQNARKPPVLQRSPLSWLTLKKHGVFLDENRDVVTYTPTFAPFLYLLLLDFDGILHAL